METETTETTETGAGEATGRLLDAHVAEKVMGWTRGGGLWSDVWWCQGGNRTRLAIPDWDASRIYCDFPGVTVWNPSQDIADAWQVVDAMEAKGFWASMKTPWTGRIPGGKCTCIFIPHGKSDWGGRVSDVTRADSLPEAICRAALKAAEENTTPPASA